MKVRLYSVFDRVAMEYSPAFEAINDGVALRMFADHVKDNPHAEDYKVLCIGEFDRSKGTLSSAGLPVECVPGQLEFELVKEVR